MFYGYGGEVESDRKGVYNGIDPFDGFAVRVGNDEESKLVQETAFSYGYKWKDVGSIFQTCSGSYSLVFLKSENRIGFSPKDNKNFKQTYYDEMKKLGFLHKLDAGHVYVQRCIETKKIHRIFRSSCCSSVDMIERKYSQIQHSLEPGFTYKPLCRSKKMHKWFEEMEEKNKWLDPYPRLNVENDFRYGELDDNWHEKFYKLTEREVYFGKTEANNKVYEYLFKAGHEMECRYLMLHSETISGVTSHAYNNSCLKKGVFRKATNEEFVQFIKSMKEEKFVSKEKIPNENNGKKIRKATNFKDSSELEKGNWYVAYFGPKKVFMNYHSSSSKNHIGHGFDLIGNWNKPGSEFGKNIEWIKVTEFSKERDTLNEMFKEELKKRYRPGSIIMSVGKYSHRCICTELVGSFISNIYLENIIGFDTMLIHNGEGLGYEDVYKKGNWAEELTPKNIVGMEILIKEKPVTRVNSLLYYGPNVQGDYPYRAIIEKASISNDGKFIVKCHNEMRWIMSDFHSGTEIKINTEFYNNVNKNSDKKMEIGSNRKLRDFEIPLPIENDREPIKGDVIYIPEDPIKWDSTFGRKYESRSFPIEIVVDQCGVSNVWRVISNNESKSYGFGFALSDKEGYGWSWESIKKVGGFIFGQNKDANLLPSDISNGLDVVNSNTGEMFKSKSINYQWIGGHHHHVQPLGRCSDVQPHFHSIFENKLENNETNSERVTFKEVEINVKVDVPKIKTIEEYLKESRVKF